MPSVRALLAVAALATAASAPAAADAQWSQPQTVSRDHSAILPREIGFTASGTAVASWGWADDLGDAFAEGASTASRGASEAAFSRPKRELARDVVSGPVPYGSRRAIIARLHDVPGVPARGRDTLRIQFGDVSGRFGKARTIARRSGIRHAQLAANPRGDAALAWFEDRGTSNDRVYVSLRRAGGSFGRPRRLAQERIRNVSVAVGSAGDVLVAWDARGRIRARFKGRSDAGFRRTDTLRSEETFQAALRTGVAASGRAWVAWTAQLLTEGGRGEAFVQAALRSPGGRRFDPALLLARAPGSATPSPVSLALDADGAATLAWTMWAPSTTAIQAARVSTSGAPVVQDVTRFASIEPLDTATAAADRDGNAVVAWTQNAVGNTSRLFAALQAPGGAWGAPELVSGGLQALAPVAAYPPGGGAPLVLFVNRPAGPREDAVAQVATRRG